VTIPMVVVGLYRAQRPAIGAAGKWGALLLVVRLMRHAGMQGVTRRRSSTPSAATPPMPPLTICSRATSTRMARTARESPTLPTSRRGPRLATCLSCWTSNLHELEHGSVCERAVINERSSLLWRSDPARGLIYGDRVRAG